MDGSDIIITVKLTVKEDVERSNIFELFFKYVRNIVTGDIAL